LNVIQQLFILVVKPYTRRKMQGVSDLCFRFIPGAGIDHRQCRGDAERGAELIHPGITRLHGLEKLESEPVIPVCNFTGIGRADENRQQAYKEKKRWFHGRRIGKVEKIVLTGFGFNNKSTKYERQTEKLKVR
jgi:hypothetical protein